VTERPYTDLASYLRGRFGCRVQKISVDAGLTCPNRDGTRGTGGCIYCNERGSGTGASRLMTVAEQLRSAKAYLAVRYKAKKFLAYFQSFSNTYAPPDTLRAIYDEALGVEDVAGLAVGTRPDCAGDDILDLLAEYDDRTFLWVEYGLQSIHDRTLSLINRGHDAGAFLDAVARTRQRGINVVVHVILGLPGETKDDMIETARALAGIDIQGVKIHVLYVARGTRLHDMYESGAYRCLGRDEYVDIVCDFLALLPRRIVIHRLTGDPHRGELIAPSWTLDKESNLRAVREELARRGLYQGALAAETERH